MDVKGLFTASKLSSFRDQTLQKNVRVLVCCCTNLSGYMTEKTISPFSLASIFNTVKNVGSHNELNAQL